MAQLAAHSAALQIVLRPRFGEDGRMERRGRRLWVALAGALALHALVLLALTRLPHAKVIVTPPGPVVTPIVLLKLAPTSGTSQPDEKSLAPAKSTARRRAAAAPPENPALAPVPDVRAEDEHESRPRDWRADGIYRPGGGLSLQLAHPEDALPGRSPPGDGSSGLVQERTRAEKLAEEKEIVSRRIESWVSDARGKQRAEAGRDGYWQAVQDRLARGFDPGWDVLEQGPKDAPRSSLGAFIDSWKKQAAAYGRSGNPFSGLPGAPGATRPLHDEFIELANADRGLDSVSLGKTLQPFSMVLAAGAVSGNVWHHSLIALVRISLRGDGSLLAVELSGTSGNAAYDRLVLGKARSLGTLPSGTAPLARETLWAFETDFTQIPPLPLAGCALDDFIPKNCWRPLQKLQHSRVRLLAIY
jgi:TonB-like protein